jgi:hypothetical protein
MRRIRHFLLVGIVIFQAPLASAQLVKPAHPLWKPIADTVYLQEVSSLINTDHALTAVAVHEGRAYVGDAGGVSTVEGESLRKVAGPKGTVSRLRSLNGTLYAAASDGLWTLSGSSWAKRTGQQITDICLHDGRVMVVSGGELFMLGDKGLEEIKAAPGARVRRRIEGGPILGVASYGNALYVHDGKHVGLFDSGRAVYENIADFGRLDPGCTVRDFLTFGSRLIAATDKGLQVLRGMTWYPIDGRDGLCYHDTTALALGFDRDLWIGTARGAIRNVGDEYQFFGHARWIPHDHVNAIATGDKVVYIATDGGLGIIRYEPYTLAKKAAYYERWLDEWGMKRLGFIHALFFRDGRWLREISDNDVGYSSHYLDAKCFEYAVTHNAASRAAAVDMMKTVKWSEEITSIEGFPARSIYHVGERTVKATTGSGGLPAEWNPTPDGVWEWKGDTSSDEVDAQVYTTTLFLELVANEQDRVWATDHLRRVIGHIVDNGFVLKDVDGKPTRWGRWDPAYLQRPYGWNARGLNSLEIISYLTVAQHFAGDEKFSRAKKFQLGQGYLNDIVHQKLVFPPGSNTHFDDRLAFYSYYPLLQYETDPRLKSIWGRSLERSWEIKRSEAAAWFNFIYGALTGNDCETKQAADHLRGWPLDLRRYSYKNSHRDDLWMPKGYRMYAERPKPFNPRETEPGRWDHDFMELEGGGGGKDVADPGGWLDAYWMGRYYGLITAPQTDDPSLVSVPRRNLHLGAAPYSGPARPKLWHETGRKNSKKSK